MPSDYGTVGAASDQYCNICNPLQYQTSIMANKPVRIAHIKDTVDLYADIKNGTLPVVSYVKPSGWVDSHPASSKFNLFEGFVKKIVDEVKSNGPATTIAKFISVKAPNRRIATQHDPANKALPIPSHGSLNRITDTRLRDTIRRHRFMDESTRLAGSLRALLLFDIAEEIDLPLLRRVLRAVPGKREPAFRHPAPEYVRYERPPVVENLGLVPTKSGEEVLARIRYFDYGVASVELRMPFHLSWHGLVRLANQWLLSPELEATAGTLLRERLLSLGESLKKPYENWISEDYYVIQVDPVTGPDQNVCSAEDLIEACGDQIAQIVRGEENLLSPGERHEVLQSSMSYYPADLLVVGWVAAFVYDTPQAALPTIELLEYANSQLLEFRYYDEVLTRVLADVYKQLDKKRGLWGQWKLAREAGSLNTIRLDYRELVERTDNAIKFLSDMFYARTYRLAAARIGVSDYRNLVTDKLSTARDLYETMVNEFHQGRAFFLEVMVVVILIIEIVFLFRGKG